jgi:hypothetical protein
MVLRSFLGRGRVPVVAVMRERAVVLPLGVDSGLGGVLCARGCTKSSREPGYSRVKPGHIAGAPGFLAG